MKYKGTIKVFTDGSANNKKTGKGARIGGVGVVIIVDDKVVHEYHSIAFSNTTSARMEVLGAVRALELCPVGYKIFVYSDNQYVVNAANNWIWGWIKKNTIYQKKNYDLWKRYIHLRNNKHAKRSYVKFIWVKGHNGNVFNELADKLANKGRLNKIVKEDKRNGTL